MKQVNLLGISGKAGSGKDLIGKIIQYLQYNLDQGTDISFDDYEIESLGYDNKWQIKKFATKVKQILSLLTGIPIEDFEKEEVKNSYLGEEWNRWKLYDKSNRIQQHTFITKEQAGYFKMMQLETLPYLNLIIEELPITIRQSLQWIGTDLFRDKFHPNTWVNALFADYKGYHYANSVSGGNPKHFKKVMNHPNWIISDVRFENEAQAIKDRGGILIRINRNLWAPNPGDIINIKVFSNWSTVTYTHTDKEGKHHGIGTDGFKYKSNIIREFKHEHSSETALDDYGEFDYVIENDSDIPSLIKKVEVILKGLKII